MTFAPAASTFVFVLFSEPLGETFDFESWARDENAEVETATTNNNECHTFIFQLLAAGAKFTLRRGKNGQISLRIANYANQAIRRTKRSLLSVIYINNSNQCADTSLPCVQKTPPMKHGRLTPFPKSKQRTNQLHEEKLSGCFRPTDMKPNATNGRVTFILSARCAK